MRSADRAGERTAAPTLRPAIAWQRNLILATLLTFAVGGWVVIIDQGREPTDMGHGMMSGPDLTMGRSALLFLAMWVAMMIAMMFPAAAPMALTYARMPRADRGSSVLFMASYITLWFAFGAMAYALSVGVENSVSGSEWLGKNWGRLGGVLLLAAGLYQLTRIKDVCLRHCRSPVTFVMEHWHGGEMGAISMGLRHGVYCFGCCWLLFLVLVPLGVMNVAAMVAVAFVVFAEKVTRWGRTFGRVAAVGLIVYGAIVMTRPDLLPTVA